jgi:hypothetical protein
MPRKLRRDPVDVDDPRGPSSPPAKPRSVPDLTDVLAIVTAGAGTIWHEVYGIPMAERFMGLRRGAR